MHYNDSNSAVARASRIRHAHDMEATLLDSMHRQAVPARPNVFSRAITRLRRQSTGPPNPLPVPVPRSRRAPGRDGCRDHGSDLEAPRSQVALNAERSRVASIRRLRPVATVTSRVAAAIRPTVDRFREPRTTRLVAAG